MNKKIILSTALVSTLFAINLSAVSTEDRITALENEIKALKTGKANSKMVNEMDERLETVETRTIVDRISLGLGMRVEMNNMSTTYANGTSPANEDPIFRTKLNLNMKSDIADNLKFTGRLSSYKNWGDSNTDEMAMASMDAKQGRTPDNSSALYVERAYLDWALNNGSDYPMFLTIGRQPSSDGPSYQIKEGTTRKGTYDALAFDGAADGIVFTANLDKALPGTTSLRFAYGTPNNASSYDSTMKDTKVSGIFLDKTCSLLNADHLIQIYAVNAKDLMGNPSLADMNASASLDENVGDLGLYGAMFEVQNVAGFDFFAHYAHSTAKPNGHTVYMGAPYGNVGLLSGGDGVTTPNNGSTTEKSGNAIWLGTQYSIKDWSFGAEYNKGSENWFSFTFSPNDPINKLATRGTATELYVAKKINKYANIRLGYVAIDYDYTGSGSWLGAPMAITNPFAATQVKESKNTYLTFNVLF